MMNVDLETLESRHDVVREQLVLMDAWVEELPIMSADRRTLMRQIVDFLQHYVLVDAAWEEAHLLTGAGRATAMLKAEHRFIARWINELDTLTQGAAPLDAVGFRRRTYKLLGLLEAHMDAEETALQHMAARVDRAPAEPG